MTLPTELPLPDDLVRRIQMRAERRNRSFESFCIDLIRFGLEEDLSRPTPWPLLEDWEGDTLELAAEGWPVRPERERRL